MPTVEINGQECIGTLEIPSLGLKFPVISEWSDEKLKRHRVVIVALRT